MIQRGVRILQAGTYIAINLVHNYAWQQNSRSLWLYYTSNKGFTANGASFHKNKDLYIRHDLLLDILREYARAGTMQRACRQVAEKETEIRGKKLPQA